MIESDLGLVFHTRFPRSRLRDFDPNPIVQELWMTNYPVVRHLFLWKTSFTKPCEIYIRLYISGRT